MAPDLSEKLLGIDIDDADGGRRRDANDPDDDQEELEQFVFFGLGDHRFAIPVAAVSTLAEVPDELTRVPRAPTAIEGMVDLRGEITAVVDPRVHFPGIGGSDRSGRERLLVLDRPADQQSAAIRVDDVIGVETVPVSDIFDETSIEDGPLSGDALSHPLVVALIQQERSPEPEIGEVVASSRAGTEVTADGSADAAAGSGAALSTQAGLGGSGDGVGTPFALESDEPAEQTPSPPDADAEPEGGVVVEATPLVDIDRLLLASGQRERSE